MSVWKTLQAAPDTPADLEKAGLLLDRLALTELRNARANRLSGGETARMALPGFS
jgi:ABC-type phosphate/phosphonate transport system ATPase subunit